MQNANLKMQNCGRIVYRQVIMPEYTNDFKVAFNKRLIHFSIDIIDLCENLRKNRNYWVIADQLTDSATSIGANVRESRASSSTKDYIKFFDIALKSANETGYWLELIIEGKYSNSQNLQSLLSEVDEIARIIAAGIVTMRKKL
jgi:four helix bundle protein